MAYEELKQRQSVMWGSGPYQQVTETIRDLHEVLLERLEPTPGVRWLDLACAPAPSRREPPRRARTSSA